MNCDGDVPLDIALDETTESLIHKFTVKQGESGCFVAAQCVHGEPLFQIRQFNIKW